MYRKNTATNYLFYVIGGPKRARSAALNYNLARGTSMEDTKSFAEMLEETNLAPKHFDAGEKTEATVVKISPEWIFIDLGAKSEGYLDKNEFLDEEGNLTVKEGDTITA
jgi:small subunit ribosomal protein S1